MKTKLQIINLIFFLSFFCFLYIVPFAFGQEDISTSQSSANKKNEFSQLVQKLIQDGFKEEQIMNLFSSNKIFFNPEGVSKFFIHTESNLDYDQFISRKSLSKAFKYMKKHSKILDQAEKKYGVDKNIITAILLVETHLGSYLGKRRVINTLSTMAALTNKSLQEKVWNYIPDKKKPKRKTFDKKVKKRSKWGYEELKALIRYAEQQNFNADEIKGSYAGAMGIAQFMPSNALLLAKDGNKDGRINLFEHEDAIFSVANYLKHYGWKPGLIRQKQHKILFRYNHSNYYVDILLKIADKLKG